MAAEPRRERDSAGSDQWLLREGGREGRSRRGWDFEEGSDSVGGDSVLDLGDPFKAGLPDNASSFNSNLSCGIFSEFWVDNIKVKQWQI